MLKASRRRLSAARAGGRDRRSVPVTDQVSSRALCTLRNDSAGACSTEAVSVGREGLCYRAPACESLLCQLRPAAFTHPISSRSTWRAGPLPTPASRSGCSASTCRPQVVYRRRSNQTGVKGCSRQSHRWPNGRCTIGGINATREGGPCSKRHRRRGSGASPLPRPRRDRDSA